MVAHSVTGIGTGSSGKLTTKELSVLANAPSILVAGRIDVIEEEVISSPPSTSNTVTLNPSLPGDKSNYVVIVTGLNTGSVYIGQMSNDGNGDFNNFVIFSEGEGTCMYFITKVGSRPTL